MIPFKQEVLISFGLPQGQIWNVNHEKGIYMR